MRALPILCAIVLANAAAFSVLGCSSDSPKLVTTEAPQTEETPDADAPTDPAVTPTTPMPANTGGTVTPDAGPATPSADSGAGGDSGTVVVNDGGTTPPADSGPAAACSGGTSEIEPNDEATSANTLSGTACGKISVGTESDFFKYQLKDATTSVSLNYKGNITIKFTVNGQSVTWGNGNFPTLPFVKGMPYILEVKSADSKPGDYTITLSES